MATLTRSNRRIDGVHPHHASPNTHLIATSAARNAGQTIFPRGAAGRNKRPLDGSDREFDALSRKRSKISVEILPRTTNGVSRPALAPVAPPLAAAPQAAQQRPQRDSSPRLPQQPHAPSPPHSPAHSTPLDNSHTDTPIDITTQATTATTSNRSEQPSQAANPSRSKQHSKAKNGILHELDRLQPSAPDTKPEGRKLRSQETSRFKSELSAYFPEYDEVIGNESKENPVVEDLLNLDTQIVILETSPHQPDTASTPPHNASPLKPETSRPAIPQATDDVSSQTAQQPTFPVRSYGDALFDDLYDSQRIDFGFLETRHKGKTFVDPLADSYYEVAHKKAERLEKSVRNAEKVRAQHERDRIIRLLDGLQGHDWLRVMGVSGITEGRKKSFEPARDHFIRGCEAILDKFRRWTLEEKRRKLEKDRAASERAQNKEVASKDGGSDGHAGAKDTTSHTGDDDASCHSSVVSEPLSDVDASIAKQLHEEVLARSRILDESPVAEASTKAASTKATSASGAKKKDAEHCGKQGAKSRAKPPTKTAKRKEPEPEKEFTSFFAKKHERATALSRNRRTGRKVLAWGHPIPDMPEADYELPSEVLDADVVKLLARKRRRDRRGEKS